MWARDVDPAAAARYEAEAGAIRDTFVQGRMLPGEADLAAWEVVARLRGLTHARDARPNE